MTTENYSRFIKGILKEAAEIDRTDDTKKDIDEKVKKIYIEKLNCFICYIMYALYSPELDDIEKAQYALKKFEENPFFLLDGDFYAKELVKYKDKDINAFYDSVFVHNDYWMHFELKFAAVLSEFQKNFDNNIEGSEDKEIISDTMKYCCVLARKISLLVGGTPSKPELKAAFLNAFDKNIPVSKARKYIENFLEKKKCFDYWKYEMLGHNERLLKAYMNVLDAINVDVQLYPNEEKLLIEKIQNMKLSDLTLPGFVLFFIIGEKDKDFRKYIKGDGKNIDINFLKKDANILRFSSISWLYNIFYLRHFVYFNAWLIFEAKEKLARSVAEYFGKFIHDIELLDITKSDTSIKDIYEVNEKLLEWIEREEWKQSFLDDLEEYKSCILQEDIKVEFPKLKSENNITRGRIVEIKVDKCAPILWSTYDKLEQVKDKISFIDFEVKKRLAIEYLNAINRSENEEKREKIKQLLDEIIYICKA